MKRRIMTILCLLLLTACAGTQRGCASFNAENFASDWLVVQYGFNGVPINCWKLPNTSISNEGNSDGIYWLDANTGNLVHISGWYNRVQGRSWDTSAKSLGIDANLCGDGAYPVKK